MGLATGGQYLLIGDLHPALLVIEHRLLAALQLTAEVGQLRRFVLLGGAGRKPMRVLPCSSATPLVDAGPQWRVMFETGS
ncbi:hypothetical protein NJH78_20080 [Pseudomonas chlororaphis]|uniref:hypothetical protein n=1 Tax=Pseudomonas chlororaphis TaxID=587753 RepID=UPI00209B3ED3|nr:hypothetical protein [Pseudomonas chlororaphis]MCO7572286.1 hypothetical protein [Pseudomonas chlororaphis]MCO7589864.1 hypothetical protein [Pseudomonas chlororaphis]MCO7612461.1 hypothetical protein [Pseudomonas chlororaphis]